MTDTRPPAQEREIELLAKAMIEKVGNDYEYRVQNASLLARISVTVEYIQRELIEHKAEDTRRFALLEQTDTGVSSRVANYEKDKTKVQAIDQFTRRVFVIFAGFGGFVLFLLGVMQAWKALNP